MVGRTLDDVGEPVVDEQLGVCQQTLQLEFAVGDSLDIRRVEFYVTPSLVGTALQLYVGECQRGVLRFGMNDDVLMLMLRWSATCVNAL